MLEKKTNIFKEKYLIIKCSNKARKIFIKMEDIYLTKKMLKSNKKENLHK